MRFALVCLVALSLFSCNKKPDPLTEYLTPKDTSLYISFNLDGEHYKYYQNGEGESAIYLGTSYIIDGKKICNFCYNYLFLDPNNRSYPYLSLIFWDTVHTVSYNYLSAGPFSKRIRNSFRVTFPKLDRSDITESDTIFMVGAGFIINYNNLYTSTYFIDQQFDPEIFTKEPMKSSFFRISSVSDRGDLKQVEGSFSTIILDKNSILPEPKIEPFSGTFRFLTK